LVLLFSTRQPTSAEVKARGNHLKRYRFEGVFEGQGWEYFVPKRGKRANDKLLVFHLTPAGDI
jgi:hypothetical protein